MTDKIAIFTAAIAFGGVMIGQAISVYIVHRQIRASVVSTNRQAWINDLRNAIAEWLTEHQVVFALKFNDASERLDNSEFIQKFVLLEYRIRLLINPKEPDHAKLVRLLRKESDDLLEQHDPKLEPYDRTKIYGDDEIILLSQSILKREWERVKKGD